MTVEEWRALPPASAEKVFSRVWRKASTDERLKLSADARMATLGVGLPWDGGALAKLLEDEK